MPLGVQGGERWMKHSTKKVIRRALRPQSEPGLPLHPDDGPESRADAEELFQETNLTLWRTWDRYDASLDFVRWAYGIAHNEIRNFARKKRASHVLLSDQLLDSWPHCESSTRECSKSGAEPLRSASRSCHRTTGSWSSGVMAAASPSRRSRRTGGSRRTSFTRDSGGFAHCSMGA